MNRTAEKIEKRALPDFGAEFESVVKSNLSPKKLREKTEAYHEKDIASALERLSEEETKKLFRILPTEKTAEILEYSEDTGKYFKLLNMRQKSEVLALMEAATALEALMSLEKSEKEALEELLSIDVKREINLLGSFGEDETGSKMSTNFVEIPEGATIKEAMTSLVRQAAENDNIALLYVTDESGTFCGAVDLKDLIVAREETQLSEITKYSYPYVYAKQPINECVTMFVEYSEQSMPVLDDDNKLIGVVTAQDFVEIIDDELGEDYAKLGGLTAEEDLNEAVLKSVGKRLPWLMVLLLLGMGVSAVVGLFESIVAQLPIIMCFQSLVLDMAGNVGTQSLAVAIRVLMDAKIGTGQKVRLIWKEARIGLANGVVLGILSFAAIGGYLSLQGNGIRFSFGVSACLGSAMLLAMTVSSLSGTLIPILFEKMGVDPAVASGPLITTVNDLVAVVSYYGLAWLILINFMQY